MSNLKVTPLSVSVHYKNENPVFGECCTHVIIDDEASGPIIILKQCNDYIEPGEVKFDMEELESVVKEARKLIKKYPKNV